MAVLAGLFALLRDGVISPDTRLGWLYLITTVVTCLTAFGIFQHGSFGKAHAAAIVTLLALALAVVAGRSDDFGRAAPYVEKVSYSFTFFIHLIPASRTSRCIGPPRASAVMSPRASNHRVRLVAQLQGVAGSDEVGLAHACELLGMGMQCWPQLEPRHPSSGPGPHRL